MSVRLLSLPQIKGYAMNAKRKRLQLFGVIILIAASEGLAQRYIEANLGLMISKSSAGVSIGSGFNEFNLGLKSHPLDLFATRDLIIQPGISYNRTLPLAGIYASFTYAPIYVRMEASSGVSAAGIATRDPFIGSYYFMDDGWNNGEFFFGLGKTFQFHNWGIHVDGNIITPATPDFVKSWFYQLGAAASYRFKLGN